MGGKVLGRMAHSNVTGSRGGSLARHIVLVMGLLALLLIGGSTSALDRLPGDKQSPEDSALAPRTLETVAGEGTWIAQSTSSTTSEFFSVAFVDAQTGWTVGMNGTILKTTNGGVTWIAQPSGTTLWLYSVAFVDAQTGWIVGMNGTILKTTNGGATWIAQSSGTNRRLGSVTFIDAQTGWAVGDWIILKTTDGGITWTAQASAYQFYSVVFVDARTGWAVGAGGTVVKTSDGGKTWESQSSGATSYLWSVVFLDAETGWAVGRGGTIIKTTDGGATWISQSSGTASELWSVAFVDAKNGWAVGEKGTILRTADGGVTWITQTSGTSWGLFAVAFADARTGWVLGAWTILKTGDSGTTWTYSSGTELHSVTFVDARTGWAVGNAGTVLKTTDGGDSWISQFSGAAWQHLYSIAFVDAQTGLAVGYGGTILKTSNGGTTWTVQSSGTGNTLLSIALADAQTGWIVGDLGTILKTTDGGATWIVQASGTTSALRSVVFVDAQNGWAAAGDGTIHRTTDGGADWTSQSSGAYLSSLTFVDTHTGWAVGSYGTIMKTSNGGAKWTFQPSGTNATLNSVVFVDAQVGWIVGGNGTILRTTDGGTSWTPQSSGTTADLGCVDFLDPQIGWAVGGNGTILHYIGEGRSISGRVIDGEGNPIPGVMVSTGPGGSATTGTDGSYLLTDLVTGTYTISPTKAGYGFSPASRTVSVPPNATAVDFAATAMGGSFAGTVAAVWPTTQAMPTTVMQGGTAYRYFRLSDGNGNPVGGASVSFSVGSPVTSDAQGYFAYTVSADILGPPGTYPVSIQGVSIGGQSYSTGAQPAFVVEVKKRDYSYSWSYGALRKASARTDTGLIAYVLAQTNGGMVLALTESDPNRTDDDHVSMEEKYSAEAGGGVGAGLRQNISAGIAKANLDASVTTEARVRSFGSIQADFDHPYNDAQRKAQGTFLSLSVLDSASVPAQPLVVNMLKLAQARLPYLDYITTQSVGAAAKVTPFKVGVGADFGLAAQNGNVGQRKAKTIGFTLLDVGVSRLVSAILTDYGNEYSTAFDDEVSADLTVLSPDVPFIETRLVGLLGNVARHVYKEYFFDSSTNQLKRIELTLSSEGNPSAFTDVTKKQVAMKITIPAPGLTPSVVESVGATQTVSQIAALLKASSQATYETTVEDGSSVSVVPELGIPGTEIKVGLGLEVENLRNLVRERGAFLNGQTYQTETYQADRYVTRPGKNWTDLVSNALGGLWLLAGDAFNWVSQQVNSGISWAIGTVSHTVDGAIRGGAQIIAPSGTSLFAAGSSPSAVRIQQTDPITVTAVSWVPTTTVGINSFGMRGPAAAASGEGFVVGGIYDFKPYTLTVSPAASLVITYTDDAALGVDKSRIGLFRWQSGSANWQPLAAQSDLANNTFTATITQLGTFALGYDSRPPQISFTSPSDGSVVSNSQPLLSAMLADTGSGIDQAAAQMRLDGQLVASTYVTGTGQLVFLPTTPLALGTHTVAVSARDVVGNSSTLTESFTVTYSYSLVLPLVTKNHAAGW